MKNLSKFLKSIWCLYQLHKAGFYLTNNTHRSKDGLWGFFRLNYEKNNIEYFAILDIDFNESVFYHIHTGWDKNIFRIDLSDDDKSIQ